MLPTQNVTEPKKGVPLNLSHLSERAFQSANWPDRKLSHDDFQELLKARIASLDIKQTKEDIQRFIYNPRELDIWSQEYFLRLSEMLKIQE